MNNAQVSWWAVHGFVAPYLDAAAPMVGTPAWCALEDDDPAKWAALLDAAQHWALRLETCQQAACQAAHDISATYDWTRIAAYIRAEAEFYKRKPYLKRRSA